jgi:hypothetical protein
MPMQLSKGARCMKRSTCRSWYIHNNMSFAPLGAAALHMRASNSRTRSACATSVVATSGKGDLAALSCPVPDLTHLCLQSRVSEASLSPRLTVACRLVLRCLTAQEFSQPISKSGDESLVLKTLDSRNPSKEASILTARDTHFRWPPHANLVELDGHDPTWCGADRSVAERCSVSVEGHSRCWHQWQGIRLPLCFKLAQAEMPESWQI